MSTSAIRFAAMPMHEMVLISASLDGKIVAALGPTNKVCGWKASALLGKSMADSLIPDRLREQHLEGLAEFGRSGKAPALGHTFATEVTGSDGDLFPVWLTVFGVASDLMYGLLQTRNTNRINR